MNNLKKRREELNLTQKQVADNAQIAIRLYQYYETEDRLPNVLTAIKIAEALQTSVEGLFKVNTII